MSSTHARLKTVGDLRAFLADIPDDMPLVERSGGPYSDPNVDVTIMEGVKFDRQGPGVWDADDSIVKRMVKSNKHRKKTVLRFG